MINMDDYQEISPGQFIPKICPKCKQPNNYEHICFQDTKDILKCIIVLGKWAEAKIKEEKP